MAACSKVSADDNKTYFAFSKAQNYEALAKGSSSQGNPLQVKRRNALSSEMYVFGEELDNAACG